MEPLGLHVPEQLSEWCNHAVRYNVCDFPPLLTLVNTVLGFKTFYLFLCSHIHYDFITLIPRPKRYTSIYKYLDISIYSIIRCDINKKIFHNERTSMKLFGYLIFPLGFQDEKCMNHLYEKNYNYMWFSLYLPSIMFILLSLLCDSTSFIEQIISLTHLLTH